MSEPHPTIEGVDVIEYTENELPAMTLGTGYLNVWAERESPDDTEPVGFALGEWAGTEWLSANDARTFGAMLIAAADWIEAQGATN